MSLIAMVALEWAGEAPQDLAAVVPINTILQPFSPFWQRLRPANYASLLRLALFGGTPLALRVRRAAFDQQAGRRFGAAALAATASTASRNAWQRLAPAARGGALRPPRTLPQIPVLVLGSEQDSLVSVACSKALALHGAYALRLHPDAGHDLPLDDAPWVAQQVRQWLEG